MTLGSESCLHGINYGNQMKVPDDFENALLYFYLSMK